MAEMFILVPETFERLAEKTGLTIEYLQNLYSQDKDFGLITKIILMEKKDALSRIADALEDLVKGLETRPVINQYITPQEEKL